MHASDVCSKIIQYKRNCYYLVNAKVPKQEKEKNYMPKRGVNIIMRCFVPDKHHARILLKIFHEKNSLIPFSPYAPNCEHDENTQPFSFDCLIDEYGIRLEYQSSKLSLAFQRRGSKGGQSTQIVTKDHN